jgi:hypothetical protein
MTELKPDENPRPDQDSTNGKFPWISAILGVGLIASLGLGFVLHSDGVNQRLEIATLQKEIAGLRDQVKNAQSGASQALEVMRQDLDATKKETADKVVRASSQARRQADAMATKLGTEISTAQEERDKKLAAQLDEIKVNAQQATARLTEITGEVGTVKTDVASTKTDLDKTVSDLKRVTGDLGVLSGLIATNGKQIQALRELGERDYYEFTLAKGATVHRVADVTLVVRKTDPKKNRFTVDIVADDKRLEKKDRGINEPVQFYVLSKARYPYELVVNQVTKDQIVGYISTPKVKATRSS